MDSSKSSATRARFTLVRVNPNGSTEQVSEHPSFESGWIAGQDSVHADREGAFSLYLGDRRVAKFGHARLQAKATSFEWMLS